MAAVTLPNLLITSGYLLGENGWQLPMNRNLRTLDALTQARVLDKDLTDPPTSPTPGELYAVAANPTGAWTGQAGKLALSQSGDDAPSAWRFITPKSGWRVYVVDEAKYYRYNGAVWVDDTPATGGEVNVGANLGSGVGFYSGKVGLTLQFKGLVQGTGTKITSDATGVTIQTVVISASEPTTPTPGLIWVTP